MTDYITRATKFIKQFHPYTVQYETYRKAVRMFNTDYHRHVRLKSGATRVAFITSDYVVKVDEGEEWKIREFGNCAKEYETYQFMVEHGYASYFARVDKVEYKGVCYYVMPLVKGIGKREGEAWEWITDDDASDFITAYVDDLHDGNYGWKDGHPVIFDYACSCACQE